MDFRDHSILTQVAFKGAIELAKGDLDIATPEGQAQFERLFGYLNESLFKMVGEWTGDVGQSSRASSPAPTA